ncbi:MAG: tetraacyldisaccharide 4'-kinase [Burkholderiales bacterium]|nr:tetraacyldisaccharide 4'-kinase [Burkholderiales bacterium]
MTSDRPDAQRARPAAPPARPRAADAATFADRHWYRLSWLSLLLAPAAVAFGAAVAVRRALYRRGLLRAARLAVPVVVVGNLVAGGTGKTPLVLWLVHELARRGLRPGIVSRGHGGATAAPRPVPAAGDPADYGDEPVLLAERARAPVWIGRDRAAAARALLAAHPACATIVCDDGLQHYALARDFEIAGRDARGAGNGLLLPAGPLREPRTRAVDAWVVNGAPAAPGEYAMRLLPAGFRRVDASGAAVPPDSLAGTRLHAVAGIGHPARFFAQLRALGLAPAEHPFPDHHAYRPADLDFAECDLVLMTEKDAVKCRSFGRSDLVALRVDAEVDRALADRVEARIRGRPTA